MIYFVLVIIILMLIIKLILINFEIKNISEQLDDLVLNKTHKKLTTTINNKSIQKLCSLINQNLTKQTEQQVLVKNHEEQLKKSISNLSHDLRTPLTSILGYITMIKSDKENANEYLDIIENRAKNLNGLINEFYDLSIIEDNDYVLELEKIDIVSVLTNTLMANFVVFKENDITPIIDIENKAINIIGNTDVYERIFQNLISNSIKYTAGDVKISLYEENETCFISISNKADNLTEKDVTHLFDRFYTADYSRTNKSTGLGLYIVKTLCEKLGAKVRSDFSNDNVLSIILEIKTIL